MKFRKKKAPKNGAPRPKPKIFSKLRDFKKDVLTVPNLLTGIRIGAVPLILWLLYLDSTSARIWAAVAYSLASITDFFDGWIARKYGLVTVTGKLLDPLADKFIVLLTLVVLLDKAEVALLPVLLILAREFYIFGIRALAVEHGLVISAGQGGKWKTTFQMVAIPFLILDRRVFIELFNRDWDLPYWGNILLWISVFFALQSAWVYTVTLKRRLFESTHHEEL